MNAIEHRPGRIFRPLIPFLVFTFLTLMTGCQSSSSLGPIRTEESVDLQRFMGDWYVIANIPTFIEKEAYNALETYELGDDGRRVDTTFSFNKGGFDGPLKEYNPTGFVREGTGNAVWGMRFIWPIKAEYRIVYVDDAYTRTIIGRTKRDYVWIMARTPQISDAEYAKLLSIVEEAGYDMSKVRKVPQQPRTAAEQGGPDRG
jgi:apolipoprotein D and lipocalin family protein